MGKALGRDDAAMMEMFNRWFQALKMSVAKRTSTKGALFGEEEFRELIRNLPDGIIVYDPDLTIHSMNPAAEAITGVREAEAKGRRIEPSFAKNPHFRTLAAVMFPSLAPATAQRSEPGSWPQVIDLTLEEPPRSLELTLHRIPVGGGPLAAFLKVIRDRTREEEMVRSKSEFIRTAAHQLRTPLNAIQWSLENLTALTKDGTPEVVKLVNETLSLARRSLKTANDFLDVSKIEEGKFGYAFGNLDLPALLRTLSETVSPIAKQYSVSVYCAPYEGPPLIVKADPGRLSTAFLNLLDNAIRYNVKGGKVTVTIERLTDRPFAKVTVEDTGVGIPPAEIGRLFEKLMRGSNVTQIEPNGSGLGLFIAKNIVRRHGGDIGAGSVLNRGSAFWITLPTDPALIPEREVAPSVSA